ncbi:MAG: DUF86 domain-containing protein [Paludibacter sp.]|jgi:uncharacterized protein with HEPN domain|nr:DUF86 domain-containing protein [Paludibacter sp.]
MDKVSKYLFDIQHSISLIEDFLKGIDSFSAYEKDLKTQSAIERQLGIIGEVISKLKQENTDFTLTNAKQIIDFRNRIIHSYDNIDNSIVWVIIKRHLSVLKQEIEEIMS